MRQKTIKAPIHCSGIALHSGSRINMVLLPAAPGTGIIFRRTDQNNAEIIANWRNVVDSSLCTTIGNANGLKIATIEHLMAAFAGLELDNVIVELDGPEVPVMDGSSAPFVSLIERVGIADQRVTRRAIKILKPVSVTDGNASASFTPDDGFHLTFAIDFASSAIQRQELTFDLDAESFKHEISSARTFGFLHEVDQLRAAGLARGGSLENAVVISGDRVLNQEGLRYSDEFVRHKVLDALGDLYLAGAPIIGHFHGVRSGHAMNRRLLEALFADSSAWRPIPFPAPVPAMVCYEEPQRVRA
jgi:UDP-3-O-[3-hydroxymyristoyl] N-acetylglucosamine deacetylase